MSIPCLNSLEPAGDLCLGIGRILNILLQTLGGMIIFSIAVLVLVVLGDDRLDGMGWMGKSVGRLATYYGVWRIRGLRRNRLVERHSERIMLIDSLNYRLVQLLCCLELPINHSVCHGDLTLPSKKIEIIKLRNIWEQEETTMTFQPNFPGDVIIYLAVMCFSG